MKKEKINNDIKINHFLSRLIELKDFQIYSMKREQKIIKILRKLGYKGKL